jgi:hypothetical protein
MVSRVTCAHLKISELKLYNKMKTNKAGLMFKKKKKKRKINASQIKIRKNFLLLFPSFK